MDPLLPSLPDQVGVLLGMPSRCGSDARLTLLCAGGGGRGCLGLGSMFGGLDWGSSSEGIGGFLPELFPV